MLQVSGRDGLEIRYSRRERDTFDARYSGAWTSPNIDRPYQVKVSLADRTASSDFDTSGNLSRYRSNEVPSPCWKGNVVFSRLKAILLFERSDLRFSYFNCSFKAAGIYDVVTWT